MNISDKDPMAIELSSAIKSGNVEALQELLDEDSELATARIVDSLGVHRSLLHIASDWPGHFPNAQIIGTDKHAEAPLHWAASSDDVDVINASQPLADTKRRAGPKMLWVLCAFSWLILASCPLHARAADLPAKLSDSEFWQLVTDLSEPNGQFQYENFVSNEYALQSVIPALKLKAHPGGVYIGVGPEQNFTYIAALQPKIAFVIDIRRQNLLEHLMYKAIFEMARDRADFVSLLFSRKRPAVLSTTATAEALFQSFKTIEGRQLLFDQNLSRIMHRLTIDHKFSFSDEDRNNLRYIYTTFFRKGPALDYTVGGFYGFDSPPSYADLMTADDGQGAMWSFLASEQNFQTVKKLEAANLVVPVVGDFAGAKAVRAVGRYLAAHHAPVTAFYLSNVERYLFATEAWRRFYVNVAILPYDEESMFIRSVFDVSSYDSISSLSRIDDIMAAFSEAKILRYADIIALSH